MITINFYNEIKNTLGAKNFEDFKQQISILYFLDPVDVQELVYRYKDDEGDYITISSENDFMLAVSLKKALTIELEISEKSRLFMTTLEKKQSTGEKALTPSEILKQEIAAKELELKKLMEEEELIKAAEKIRKAEEAKIEAAKQAEVNKVNIFRKNIQNMITKTINENIEKVKQQLITDTVNQTLVQVESMMKGTEIKEISCAPKIVHQYVRCDGCGVAPIVGIRYKCTECHNFDFCETCEELSSSVHCHNFIKIRDSNNYKAQKCTRNVERREVCVEVTKQDNKNDLIKIDSVSITSPDEVTGGQDSILKSNYCIIDTSSIDFVYKTLAEELRATFALDGISLDKIIDEIRNNNGDLDMTLAALFNM